jgi:hypothetical protein
MSRPAAGDGRRLLEAASEDGVAATDVHVVGAELGGADEGAAGDERGADEGCGVAAVSGAYMKSYSSDGDEHGDGGRYGSVSAAGAATPALCAALGPTPCVQGSTSGTKSATAPKNSAAGFAMAAG